MNKPLLKASLSSLALLFLTACSSLPETLESDNDQLVSDYGVWVTSDSDTKQQVRMGGVIADVTNLADKTRIVIVNLPINDSGKPDIKEKPNGRFVGYVDGFLEPLAYSKGQLISVIGQSNGTEDITVGEFEQTIPVMNVTGYHAWKIQERVVIDEIRTYQYNCWGLHCRQMSYGPRDGRVIKEVK
ncbi:Slp family lipoprotein [Vibrio amylolyticus]|uniref:Slp family lipoprotein n=1 Tax=Vibrio amylolyticus TaxID=2847292 RepID=UPI003550AD2A